MRSSRYHQTYLKVAALLAAVYLVLPSNVSAFFWQDAEANTTTSTAAAEKSADETAENNLVVTNNTAVVRFSPSAWDRLPLIGGHTANETVFQIQATTKDVPDVFITSSGLGNAVFIVEGSQANVAAKELARDCRGDSWTGTPSLHLSDLKVGEDVKVRMRFPCDLVSDPGDNLEGKILVMAPQQKMLEVPLKIQSPPASSFYTALLWFFGVFVGVLITGGVGYGFTKLQTERTEYQSKQAVWHQYTLDNHTTLATFFEVVYARIVAEKDDVSFAQQLRTEFETREMIAIIPAREWRRLDKALNRNSRNAITKCLAKLFPRWKEQIKHGK